MALTNHVPCGNPWHMKKLPYQHQTLFLGVEICVLGRIKGGCGLILILISQGIQGLVNLALRHTSLKARYCVRSPECEDAMHVVFTLGTLDASPLRN
jgi:hypothetical protein